MLHFQVGGTLNMHGVFLIVVVVAGGIGVAEFSSYFCQVDFLPKFSSPVRYHFSLLLGIDLFSFFIPYFSFCCRYHSRLAPSKTKLSVMY